MPALQWTPHQAVSILLRTFFNATSKPHVNTLPGSRRCQLMRCSALSQRRCVDEDRGSKHDAVKEELKSAAQLIVRYAATLLTVPDMFGDSTTDSNRVLCDAVIGMSPGGLRTSNPLPAVSAAFLSQLLAEIDQQESIAVVVAPIFDGAVDCFRNPPTPGTEAPLIGARALLSLFGHKPTVTSLSPLHQ